MCKYLGKVVKTILSLGIVLIGHEVLIRKRKRIQTKALARREAQQQLSEFLTIAGHELKTPLTSIKGNIQLMGRRLQIGADRDRDSQDELLGRLAEVQELLGRADQQITRLTRLVNILLENARISNNMIELFLETCELDGLLHEVLENRLPFPSTRPIYLDHPREKAVLVLADMNRVKQVIMHYLSNAHKFSPPDQPIEVHLCEQEHNAYVSVKD
jgi:signal transduction histidine kinase